MVYYDKIDAFEGIDVNKTNNSKKCDICHYWYFLDERFKFQPNVYRTMNLWKCLWTLAIFLL